MVMIDEKYRKISMQRLSGGISNSMFNSENKGGADVSICAVNNLGMNLPEPDKKLRQAGLIISSKGDFMKIRTTIMAITAVALVSLTSSAAMAAPAGAAGYNKIVALPLSDAQFSVPFTKKAEGGTFTVSAKSGTTDIQAAAAWTPDAYNNLYYVRFVGGNAAGLWTTITDTAANTLTLEDANIYALVNVGDSFRVYKHHTLGSVFPNAMIGRSHISGTRVGTFDYSLSNVGENKAPSFNSRFTAAGAWTSGADTILRPEARYILRNTSSTQTLTLVLRGRVPDYTVSMLIAPGISPKGYDLNIGTGYPLSYLLTLAGFEGTSNRRVGVYGAGAGQNKAASFSRLTAAGTWTVDHLLRASDGITFRVPYTDAATRVTLTKPY